MTFDLPPPIKADTSPSKFGFAALLLAYGDFYSRSSSSSALASFRSGVSKPSVNQP
jgi:hypothetical protein